MHPYDSNENKLKLNVSCWWQIYINSSFSVNILPTKHLRKPFQFITIQSKTLYLLCFTIKSLLVSIIDSKLIAY